MMRSSRSVKTMGAMLSSKARRKCCSASMRACSAARWALLSRMEPTVQRVPSRTSGERAKSTERSVPSFCSTDRSRSFQMIRESGSRAY